MVKSTVSGSEHIIEALKTHQIDCLFMVPGAQIEPFFVAAIHSELKVIIANHELAAGYMADGYARASSGMGVCAGIGGPGASNLLTAAVTARLAGSSVLFLTGSYNPDKQNLGGFQDVGVTGSRDLELFKQAVLYSEQVNEAQILPEQLQIAFNTMSKPQRGPAHLILALNTQSHPIQDTDGGKSQSKSASNYPLTLSEPNIKTAAYAAADILTHHHRLVFLIGSQLLNGNPQDLQQLADIFKVPIATTAATKGLLPETHECSLGNSGFGGNNRATNALLRDDLAVLILLGLDELEQHQLSLHPQYFPPHRHLIWINQNKSNKNLLPIEEEYLVADCTQVLQAIIATTTSTDRHNSLQVTVTPPCDDGACGDGRSPVNRQEWLAELMATPQLWPASSEADVVSKFTYIDKNSGVPLNKVLSSLQAVLPSNTILCADAGATRLAATQNWVAHQPHSFLSAPQAAPMGWAIAAGIGAQMAQPERPVIVLTGDGSMRMHGIEIATAARYKLPILFVVCNNQGYGSIYSRQYRDEAVALNTRLPDLDWVGFAYALGVYGVKVTTPEELVVALQEKVLPNLQNWCQPFLLEIKTPIAYNNQAPITGHLC